MKPIERRDDDEGTLTRDMIALAARLPRANAPQGKQVSVLVTFDYIEGVYVGNAAVLSTDPKALDACAFLLGKYANLP